MSTVADKVQSGLEIIPTRFALGAEVRCGDLRKVDENTRRLLRQAWLDHLVLVFRGQSMTPQDLVNFAKIFGDIDRAAPDAEMPAGQKPRFDPHISVVSNVVEDGVLLGSLGNGEVVWHTDHSYHEVPLAASVLFAVEVPPAAGRTGFVNMYQALEKLPADIREKIAGRTIKNDSTYNSAGQIRTGSVGMARDHGNGDGHDHVRDGVAEDRHQGQGQDDQREREEDVHEPTPSVVGHQRR